MNRAAKDSALTAKPALGDAPPTRRASRRVHLNTNNFSKEKYGIQLRRFAGPCEYVRAFTEPIRVAHLTDQHIGLVTPYRVQTAAIELVNREAPDVVVITGDFVCHSHAYLDELEHLMGLFDVPVFGVLGNHDYWAGADGVRQALKRANVEVLDNANTTITLRNQRLQIVGLDDAYTGHADRRKALKGLDPKLPTLGLSHIAEEADALWAAGVPLVLSGHTHGGQVTVARLNELTIGRLAKHRYIHGLYGDRTPESEQGSVYVGAGIGAAVMPLRLGDRGKREVALFDLGQAPGTLEEHHAPQPIPDESVSERDDAALRALARARFKARRQKKMKRARVLGWGPPRFLSKRDEDR